MDILHLINQCLLNQFEKVSLEALERVKLMDRHDTKCFFNVQHLPAILESLAPHYCVLEIASLHCLEYDSLYFDTPNFDFYLHHHNKHSNRYKIRFRQYVESNKLTFFEVKFKSNKGRTIKNRVRCPDIISAVPKESLPLLQQSDIADLSLQPVLRIHYKRITLVNNDFSERATIDLFLSFEQGTTQHSLPQIAIIEVKQDRVNQRSPIMQVLHEHKIYPGSMSKYCLGMVFCHPGLKYNHFKKTILQIEKLQGLRA